MTKEQRNILIVVIYLRQYPLFKFGLTCTGASQDRCTHALQPFLGPNLKALKTKENPSSLHICNYEVFILPTGPTYRLRVSNVQAPRPEAKHREGPHHHQGRCGHRAGVPHRRVTRQTAGHELRNDVRVHRVRCRQVIS